MLLLRRVKTKETDALRGAAAHFEQQYESGIGNDLHELSFGIVPGSQLYPTAGRPMPLHCGSSVLERMQVAAVTSPHAVPEALHSVSTHAV